MTTKYFVDYVFVILISSGFVGGLLSSLKKSTRSLLCLIITFAFFSIIFVPVRNFIFNLQLFKIEFDNFVKSSILANEVREKLYGFAVSVVSAILLFLVIYLICNFVLKVVFFKFKFNSGMLVTNRVLSALMGGVKGVMFFMVIEIALVFVIQNFNLTFLNEYILNSSVGQITFPYFSEQVVAVMKILS